LPAAAFAINTRLQANHMFLVNGTATAIAMISIVI